MGVLDALRLVIELWVKTEKAPILLGKIDALGVPSVIQLFVYYHKITLPATVLDTIQPPCAFGTACDSIP